MGFPCASGVASTLLENKTKMINSFIRYAGGTSYSCVWGANVIDVPCILLFFRPNTTFFCYFFRSAALWLCAFFFPMCVVCPTPCGPCVTWGLREQLWTTRYSQRTSQDPTPAASLYLCVLGCLRLVLQVCGTYVRHALPAKRCAVTVATDHSPNCGEKMKVPVRLQMHWSSVCLEDLICGPSRL